MDSVFLLGVGAIVGALYVWLANRGDMTGWLLGVGHAVLALVATAGWSVAADTGFAVAMALLAVYGGAMSATEVIRRIRRLRPAG